MILPSQLVAAKHVCLVDNAEQLRYFKACHLWTHCIFAMCVQWQYHCITDSTFC